MALQIYLIFNSNCRNAVEFYSNVFNTPLQEILTFKDMPPEVPLSEEEKILLCILI